MPLEGSVLVRAIRWQLNTILHQILAVVAVYSIWYGCVQYSNPFSWHVILCSLGYMPLMAEAIILFANDNVWSQDLSRKTKYWIHGLLLSLSTIFITVGIWCESKLKIDYNIAHWQSEHAITGLISAILILISIVLGYFAANTSQLSILRIRPIWLKFLHNLIGILGFVFGVVSLMYAFHLRWFKYYASIEGIYCVTVLTAVVAVCALYRAFWSLFEQGRTIFSCN